MASFEPRENYLPHNVIASYLLFSPTRLPGSNIPGMCDDDGDCGEGDDC